MGDAAEKLAPVPAAPSTTEQVRARGIGGLITHAELAKALGKGNARAARDWCQSRRVPYRRDGRVNWCRVADVVRYLEGLASVPARVVADRAAAANAAAQKIMRGR